MTPLVAIGVVRRVDRLARLTDLQLCAVFKFEGDPDEEQRFRRRVPLRNKIGDRNSHVVDPRHGLGPPGQPRRLGRTAPHRPEIVGPHSVDRLVGMDRVDRAPVHCHHDCWGVLVTGSGDDPGSRMRPTPLLVKQLRWDVEREIVVEPGHRDSPLITAHRSVMFVLSSIDHAYMSFGPTGGSPPAQWDYQRNNS